MDCSLWSSAVQSFECNPLQNLCDFSAAVLKGTIVHFFEHRPNLKLGINGHLRREWVRFVTVVDVERKSHSLGRPHHMTVTYHMTDTLTPLYVT